MIRRLPHGVHPYFKLRQHVPGIKADFKLRKDEASGIKPAAAPAPITWSVPDLCTAYKWPTKLPGGGIIAIVELGGGWVQSDINSFFKSINQPVAQITDVSVDGTKNSPGTSDADVEVALDIEVSAAAYFAATGQPATIRMYWSQDIASAVQKATSDGCDVCSISWGADEANWGNTAAEQMESAAAAATAAGMAVFAAAGDNDSGDGGSTPANVDVPSSCPHVVGCGGTNKTKTSETVWNDNPGQTNGEGTGGGYSTIFPVQSFQKGAPPAPAGTKFGKGRMVPDVAADADPNTGYNIFVQGSQAVVGGTSAVAPLYAGFFAAFGKKLGFVTPTLWQNPSAFTDITSGGNGFYNAAVGPDPCSGLGVPIGASIADLFVKTAAAGGSHHGPGHHKGKKP
ncbi:MAG TPA: S53 family peptidase [Terracidiphilus sp.]|nr:S53 family peptidase [Terracidiphilus sp.]